MSYGLNNHTLMPINDDGSPAPYQHIPYHLERAQQYQIGQKQSPCLGGLPYERETHIGSINHHYLKDMMIRILPHGKICGDGHWCVIWAASMCLRMDLRIMSALKAFGMKWHYGYKLHKDRSGRMDD